MEENKPLVTETEYPESDTDIISGDGHRSSTHQTRTLTPPKRSLILRSLMQEKAQRIATPIRKRTERKRIQPQRLSQIQPMIRQLLSQHYLCLPMLL